MAAGGVLGPKSAGPYQITQKCGANTFRLDLPPGVRIHLIFNVYHLQPYFMPPTDIPEDVVMIPDLPMEEYTPLLRLIRRVPRWWLVPHTNPRPVLLPFLIFLRQ